MYKRVHRCYCKTEQHKDTIRKITIFKHMELKYIEDVNANEIHSIQSHELIIEDTV